MENRLLSDKWSGGESTVRESHANVKKGETQKKNLFLYLSRQIYVSLKKKKEFDENMLFTYIKFPETVSKITTWLPFDFLLS